MEVTSYVIIRIVCITYQFVRDLNIDCVRNIISFQVLDKSSSETRLGLLCVKFNLVLLDFTEMKVIFIIGSPCIVCTQ